MTQTLEASSKITRELYQNGETPYTHSDELGNNSPAIFYTQDHILSIPDTQDLEKIRISHQALMAHETLRRLVELRNMYDTDTFPISGYDLEQREPNPTDEQLCRAATEVAALALSKSMTQELGLQSAIPDNTNFYQPPSVEVASLLVNAADETLDTDIMALAEAALPTIDQDIAEPLIYKLHESFGITTDEERVNYETTQMNANQNEDIKLILAAERAERLKKFTAKELADLDKNDDAVAYDPMSEE